jgi:CheY-like chemotaxis protein
MTTKTILIADDDVDLLAVLAARSRRLGLEVRTARDAVETLNRVQQAPPDVVCLDVNMPCGNGLSVCEMLATDPRFRSLPVIVMTGRSDEGTVRRCHDLCAYYVLKSSDVWKRVEPLLRELLGI